MTWYDSKLGAERKEYDTNLEHPALSDDEKEIRRLDRRIAELTQERDAALLEAKGLREATLREVAKKLCNCCQIDGWPEDWINNPVEDEGSRFVHCFADGTRLDCNAQVVHEMLAPTQSQKDKS